MKWIQKDDPEKLERHGFGLLRVFDAKLYYTTENYDATKLYDNDEINSKDYKDDITSHGIGASVLP